METIDAKRFLVRSLFDGERTCQLRLVDLTGPELSVKPFETETASTVFIDARESLIWIPGLCFLEGEMWLRRVYMAIWP